MPLIWPFTLAKYRPGLTLDIYNKISWQPYPSGRKYQQTL